MLTASFQRPIETLPDFQEVYRIFQIKKGQPASLKHAWTDPETGIKSTILPMGKWLKAKEFMTTNPGGRRAEQPKWLAGWHTTAHESGSEQYLKRFKTAHDKVVCRVFVAKTRPKPTNSRVILSTWMYIDPYDWQNALVDKCSSPIWDS